MQISKDKFTHIGINEEKGQAIVRPSMTYWQDAWRRLKKSKVSMIALIILSILIVMAIIGPMMVNYTYFDNNLTDNDKSPSSVHWFGTDTLGRDLWARVWVGARVSLSIGIVVSLIEGLIGMLLGGMSGYFGGKLDMIIMRTVDILMGLPFLVIVVLIMMIMKPGILPIIVALCCVGWIGMARLVRGQVLALKEQEFVLAARTLGADSSRLIIKHLIPNCLGVIIVSFTFAIPSAIFAEAFLSYIGLGVNPPMTSWGQLAAAGAKVFQTRPYQMFIPAILISITMLSLQLFGDGLRDALDPKLRK